MNHTTRDHGNVQSHDQEESKLNSNISVNSGAHDQEDQSHDKEESKLNSNISVNSGAHDKIITRSIQ